MFRIPELDDQVIYPAVPIWKFLQFDLAAQEFNALGSDERRDRF